MVIHQKNLVILCAQIILGQALQLFALQWVESNIPTTRLENYSIIVLKSDQAKNTALLQAIKPCSLKLTNL